MFEAYFKGEGILFAPAMLILAGALGAEFSAVILRRVQVVSQTDWLDGAERVLLSILVGSLIVGLLVYGASRLGMLGKPAVYVIVAVQAVALLRGQFVRDVAAAFRSVRLRLGEIGLLQLLTVWIALGILGLFAFQSLVFTARPSLDADTSTTYIWAAKQFVYHGGFFDNGHAIGAMAKSGFLQLCYGLLLASPLVAHAWLVLLTSCGLVFFWVVLMRISGAATALFSLAVVISSGFVFEAMVVPAKFDGLTLAYGVAALALVIRAARSGLTAYEAILLGLFVGGAASLSYNNLVVGAVFVVAGVALFVQQSGRFGLVFAGIVAGTVSAMPTYLENLILYANPVYPFAGTIFSTGIGSTIPLTSYFAGYIDVLREQMAVSSLVELPGILLGIVSDVGLPTLQAGNETWFGWYFLATIPASIWAFSTAIHSGLVRNQAVDMPRLLVGVGWVIAVLSWAYSQHILRYLCFALPLGMAAVAYLANDLWVMLRTKFRLAPALLTIPLLIGAAFATSDGLKRSQNRYNAVWDWLKQSQTSAEYFEKDYYYGGVYPFGEVVSQLNRELAPGSKILSFINGNSYFSSSFDVYIGNGSNALPSPSGVARPLSSFADGQAWKDHLIAQGFDYVVVEPRYIYLTPEEEPAVLGFFAAEVPWQVIGTVNVYKL